VKHFKNAHAILPVVHVQDEAQAIRMSLMVQSAGADGVFLIGHGMGSKELAGILCTVRQHLPDFWLGVNFLDLDPFGAFRQIETLLTGGTQIDGVWTDQSFTRPDYIVRLDAVRARLPHVCYFGGTAFKYQPQPKDVESAARTASERMDFVTTSGPGTGQAANISKMQAMKSGVGTGSLALASGITPENVTQYLPYVDALLVATGISLNFREFDRAKLDQLVTNVRGWKFA
jgi:predicted TIM-barrel enzyme